MAELETFSIADRIVGKLASVAVRELAIFSGMEDQISELIGTISTIKDVLLDAEEQQVDNHQIKSWLERVEDVVYDADDFVDYFSTEAMAKLLQVRTFFSWPSQLVLRHKMGRRIKQINGKLHAIDSDRNRMDLDLGVFYEEPLVVTKSSYRAHAFVSQGEVFGRERDREAILKLLLDPKVEEEENVCAVAIVGLAGVGKTTLAQFVYNDDKVRRHFDLRMWVSVSQDFDVGLLVEKIIKSAYDVNTENLEMDQLQKELRKIINGKRYLLVLDAVWNVDGESWLNLKRLLSDGAQGGRIIITTRYLAAATVASKMEPYFLQMLDEDASWALFEEVAFKKGQGPKTPNIVAIGKDIVNKCGGNPLTIRTIGSMLYFKDSEREWYSFSKMEFTRVPQQENGIIQTLKLSFDSLPSHLKHCFAYCRIFPKECEIDVQTLINLWMAQGFIYSSEPRRCMEDIGYGYFKQLTWRSFFQDIQRDKHGIITKCKMHGLIHDLAILVAGKRCSMLSLNKDNIDTKAHHLSFNFHLDSHWQIPTSLVQAKRTRTILLSNQSQQWETEGRSSKSICGNMVLGCKTLRVLDLHNSGINIVPPSIGKLKYLRYLDLSRNINIKTLPSSITKLYHLQTLKLNCCQRLKELPRDIKKLINLRNLEIDGCYGLTHMPCGLGQLTDLRTLSEFLLSKRKDLDSRHKGGLDELKNLNNLRGELRIKNLRHGADYEVANLEKKRLKSLILIWDNDGEAMKAVANGYVQCSKQEGKVDSYLMSLNGLKPHISLKELSLSAYGGIQFPDWFSSLTNLVRLSLWGCKKCQYIPPLHQFSSLQVLTLGELTNLEYVSEYENNLLSSTETLPSLRELRLTGLPNLRGWWRFEKKEGVDDISSSTKATILSTAESYQPIFPCLSKLSIENCPELDSMPHYPYLDEVLQLNNSSVKPLQQTMAMSMAGQQIPTTTDEASSSTISHASVPSTSTFFPLSKLRNLCLVDIMELDISNGDVIIWEAFESLKFLTFDHLPQLETLPEGLQEVNSLQELHIRRCNNLKAIPDWIIKLKSLKKLAIRLLPNLTSLPVELYGHTSSQKLEIEDCPKIAQKANHVQDLIMKFLTTSEPLRIMQ